MLEGVWCYNGLMKQLDENTKAKWWMALAAVLTLLLVLGVVVSGYYWMNLHRNTGVRPPHAKFERY